GRAAIHPMVAPAESGQDLVADRPSIGRSRIDAVIVPQKLDEPAGPRDRRVDVGYVENDEIHRNSAKKGNPLAAEAARTARAQRARPTVRIADRDSCQPPRRAHQVRRTVANRLTQVNFANLQDSPLEMDNLAHRIEVAGLRIDTIEGGTGADEVEVKITAEKDAGRRGEAGRQMAEAA